MFTPGLGAYRRGRGSERARNGDCVYLPLGQRDLRQRTQLQETI